MTDSVRPSAKAAIVEAAFDILSRDPSASLALVAQRAGVGRATLHRHFPGRADLVRALALIAIDEMDQVAEAASEHAETYADAFWQMLVGLIPLGDRHGFLALEPLDNDPDIMAAYKRQAHETGEMIEKAKEEGLFDTHVPTNWIMQAFDHLLYAAWESVKAGAATPDQAAELAWRTLTQGLGVKAL